MPKLPRLSPLKDPSTKGVPSPCEENSCQPFVSCIVALDKGITVSHRSVMIGAFVLSFYFVKLDQCFKTEKVQGHLCVHKHSNLELFQIKPKTYTIG